MPGRFVRHPTLEIVAVRRTRTGQGGDDHVKGVSRLTAVGLGVDQAWDDVEKLDHRTGPSVGEQQGPSTRVG